MVGSGRLHPYVQADSHYVINPGYNTRSGDDVVLVIRPGAELDLPSDKLDLKGHGELEYQRYLGLNNKITQDYSTLAGQLGLNSIINKQGALVLNLHETLVRSADPGQIQPGVRLRHTTNDVGAGADFRPGGGALIFTGQYSFFIDRYDRTDNASSDPKNLDNTRHMPGVRVAWKFLPKTAVFAEATGLITRFPNAGTAADSNLVLAYLGASGNITPRISALLKAGYGNTLISGSDNFNSFVGQAEFNYAFTETTGFRVGVLRTAQPTSLLKYFALNRMYAGVRQAFGARIQAELNVGYDYLQFGSPTENLPAQNNRTDNDLVAEANINYQVTDWFNVALANRFDKRTSSAENIDDTGTPNQSIDYHHNDTFLRLTARY